MIYGSLARTKEDIEQAVNRAQRKYDFSVEDLGDASFKITMTDGLHNSDVVITKFESVVAEVERLVADLDAQKYDTED